MLRIKEKEVKEIRRPVIRDINVDEDSELSSKKQVQSASVQKVVVLPEDIKKIRFEA